MWNFFGKTDIQLEALRLEAMASGDESILLSERVVWEEFPAYASALAGLVGGRIIDEADSAAERVWTVSIGGQRFFLAYDDYPSGGRPDHFVNRSPRSFAPATAGRIGRPSRCSTVFSSELCVYGTALA